MGETTIARPETQVITSLAFFYRKYRGVSGCFKNVFGIIDGDRFTVTGNKTFSFPIRDYEGHVYEHGVIGRDEWRGHTFFRNRNNGEQIKDGKSRFVIGNVDN